MSPRRKPSSDDDLRERLNETFVALRRQYDQLALAFEPWRGEDGQQRFISAYNSDDAAARNQAELLHANFERCHRRTREVIELAAKLARRTGRLPKPEKGEDRIQELRRANVITSSDADLLRDQASVRNESQHAYVNTAPADVHALAERQLRDGRKLAGRLGDWTKQLKDS